MPTGRIAFTLRAMMSESWFFAGFGLIGGLLLSFVFWWVLNHRMVPSLRFADEIGRREIDFDDPSHRYQFAFKNVGRRDALDLRIKARIRIKDILKTGGIILNTYDIALSNNEIFKLAPGRMKRMSLLFHESECFGQSIFSDPIQEKLGEGTLTLDDVLQEYEIAQVDIQIIATDSFSNAMKVFNSKRYTSDDVKTGVFKGQELLVQAP
ncbi:MAG: hypothetical protein ACTSVG_01040 [Alphaproteobacteria bacterium]